MQQVHVNTLSPQLQRTCLAKKKIWGQTPFRNKKTHFNCTPALGLKSLFNATRSVPGLDSPTANTQDGSLEWSLRKPITKTLIITALEQVPYGSFELTKMEDQLGGRCSIARLKELASRRWNHINGLGKQTWFPYKAGFQVYHITNHDQGHIVKTDRGILDQLSLKRLWPPLAREKHDRLYQHLATISNQKYDLDRNTVLCPRRHPSPTINTKANWYQKRSLREARIHLTCVSP